ncbi:MAG TPA: PH domain-containing protein [Solirubrobacteraceae bacterium]|nr:PH domain-containing protein [Solirubrobacteraceae bacterium]
MDLRTGERVIFQGHPSWRSVLGFYVTGLLVTALAAGIAALVTVIGSEFDAGVVVLVALAVFVLVVIVGFVKRLATTYTITNQRLHIRKGIVARKIQQTRIERVQNVNINQSVLERVLQVGKVDFDTAGTDDSEFTFAGVSQPEEVMQAVEQAQHESANPALAAPDDGLGAGPPGQPPADQP